MNFHEILKAEAQSIAVELREGNIKEELIINWLETFTNEGMLPELKIQHRKEINSALLTSTKYFKPSTWRSMIRFVKNAEVELETENRAKNTNVR